MLLLGRYMQFFVIKSCVTCIALPISLSQSQLVCLSLIFKMASHSRKQRKRKHSETSIPFASGFRKPTERQCERAAGLNDSDKYLKEYQRSEESNFFESIPSPNSIDDWLAQYCEEGQNYKNFLSTCPWLSSRKSSNYKAKFIPEGKTILEKYPDGKIFLQPLGEFDGSCSPSINELAKYAKDFYDIPVVVLPQVRLELPRDKDGPAYWLGPYNEENTESKMASQRKSSRIASKAKELGHRWYRNGRIQLNIDSILKILRNNMPSSALCFIGLTMADLYQDHTDLFVAGMAYGNHKVAVFSFARYDPGLSFSKEFWYDIQENEEYQPEEKRSLMLQRSCKLLVHEIAHIFGIDHCIWYSCCMNGSGHLQEDFAQPIFLCPVDLHKLQRLCGFNILQRYRKLLDFFQAHGMNNESEWLERRIEYITQQE